jgi:hypothetical protein
MKKWTYVLLFAGIFCFGFCCFPFYYKWKIELIAKKYHKLLPTNSFIEQSLETALEQQSKALLKDKYIPFNSTFLDNRAKFWSKLRQYEWDGLSVYYYEVRNGLVQANETPEGYYIISPFGRIVERINMYWGNPD